ncbi:MAG: hypothetical protein EP305_06280 [Bacteroidetes bacterium]|nr:MAG: hypothetical protein EP305_06280 [Bacteroidota bacterium]
MGLMILFGVTSAMAATCTYTTTGNSTNWNSAAAWTVTGGGGCGTVPPTTLVGTGVTININHPINLTTTTLDIKSGATLNINAGGGLTLTGNLTFSNGSTVNFGSGSNISVSGNLTNNNNSTGITINGTVTVGGNLTAGQGSAIGPVDSGTGTITVNGAIITDGTATIFGSYADCPNTADPCYTTSISALPVEFISASIECLPDGVQISWNTASEHNSDYFKLEVFNDTYTWEMVAEVSAVGFSNQPTEYSVIDDNRIHRNGIFKLTQFDLDGQAKVLGEFKSECEFEEDVKIYPNPSNGEVMLSLGKDLKIGQYLMEVISLSGKLVYEMPFNYDGGNLYINIEEGFKGLFFVRVSKDDYSSELIKHSFY